MVKETRRENIGSPIAWIGLFVAVLAFLAGFWQAYVASDNEIQGLRAYVMVSSTKIGIDEKGVVDANVTIKNYGATPAMDFRHWACAYVRMSELSDSVGTDFDHGIIAPVTVIPQQETKDHPVKGWCELKKGAAITEDERAAIGRGNMNVIITGIIRYKDVFGLDHITRYRRYWNDILEHDKISADNKEGNCIDGECESTPFWKTVLSRF